MEWLFSSDSDYDLFTSETLIQMKILQQSILLIEKDRSFKKNTISKIYRILHFVKVSSDLLEIRNITIMMQALEDLFYYLFVKRPNDIDFSVLTVLVFEAVDYVRLELEGIKIDTEESVDITELVDTLKAFLFVLNHDDVPITPRLEEELYLGLSRSN